MKRLSVIFSEQDAKQRAQVKVLLKQNGYALEDSGITSKRNILQKISIGNIDAIVVGNTGSSNKQFLPSDVMDVRRNFPEIRIIYILGSRQDYPLDMLYQLYENKIYNVLFQSDSKPEYITELLIKDRESKVALHYLGLDKESAYFAPIPDQVISSLNHYIKSGMTTEDMRQRFHAKMAIYDDHRQRYYCEHLTDPVLLEAFKQDELYRKYVQIETKELPQKSVVAKKFGIWKQLKSHHVAVEPKHSFSVPASEENIDVQQQDEKKCSYSLLSSNSVLWEIEKKDILSPEERSGNEKILEIQSPTTLERIPDNFNGLIADLTDSAKDEIIEDKEQPEDQQNEDPFWAYMNRKKEQIKTKKEKQLQEEWQAIEEKKRQEEQRLIQEIRLQEERYAIEEQKQEALKQQAATQEQLKIIHEQQAAEQTRFERECQKLKEQTKIQEVTIQRENPQIAQKRRQLEDEQKKHNEKHREREQCAKEQCLESSAKRKMLFLSDRELGYRKSLTIGALVCVFGGILLSGLATSMLKNYAGRGDTVVFSRPVDMAEYRAELTEDELTIEEIIKTDTEELPMGTEAINEVPSSTAKQDMSGVTNASNFSTVQTETPVSTTETIPTSAVTEMPSVTGIELYDGTVLTGEEVINFINSYGSSYGILVESRGDGMLTFGTYGSDSMDLINQSASYYASVTYVNGVSVAIRFTQG